MTGVGVDVGHCRGSSRGDDSEKCAFHQRCLVKQKLRTSSHLTQLECLNSVHPARSFTLPLPSSQLCLAFLIHVCKLPQIRTGIQRPTVLGVSLPSCPLQIYFPPFFIFFYLPNYQRRIEKLVGPNSAAQWSVGARRTDWTQRETNEQGLVGNLA